MTKHPLDAVPIREGHDDEVRGLLRLLPEDTFPLVDSFRKGVPECREDKCGQIGIYAKKEPFLGRRGVMLVVVNEHLYGDPISFEDNPMFKIPDGARSVHLVPPRQSPLRKNHPYAGVDFLYNGARFFFGYELSDGAYSTIVENLQTSKNAQD